MGDGEQVPIPHPPSPIPHRALSISPHPAYLDVPPRAGKTARARGRALQTPLHAAAFVLFRTAILLPNIFLPYSFAAPSWRLGFKPLKALTSYVGALGYVWGWYAEQSIALDAKTPSV